MMRWQALGLCLCAGSAVGAQEQPVVATASTPIAAALTSWIALDAPPGDEQSATDAIRRAMPEWRRDVAGNLSLTRGAGRPSRVVACGLDHATFAVSAVTPDGYLRLHTLGRHPWHPLWDQSHEANRVRVLTSHGPVIGQVAVINAHMAEAHRADTGLVTVDQLWVDVGARSAADVARLGVRVLDPVVRAWPTWSYGDYVAGPDASGRTACAAVAAAARRPVGSGRTTFLITTGHAYGNAGLAAALHSIGPVDSVTVVGGLTESFALARQRSDSVGPSTGIAADRRLIVSWPAPDEHDSARVIRVGARFAGTLAESVRLVDAESLLVAVARAAGSTDGVSDPAWVSVPVTAIDAAPPPPAGIGRTLAGLVDIPAVSGHEFRMRAAIRRDLPAWAAGRTVTDSVGNLYLAIGPDRDTAVIAAHMDEVGFTVGTIAHDGTVVLTPAGGSFDSIWEGQPAILWFDPDSVHPAPAPLRGVFVPRSAPTSRWSRKVQAWFGVDSAALVAAGVRVGLAVTGYKHGSRLAGTRYTARAEDDRAGVAATLAALRRIDPRMLHRKLIFVWTVQEETHLNGARAAAERLGSSVRTVYSIDTFVTSDTPLESPTFGYAPLGHGVVLRGYDQLSTTSRADRDRVIAAAAAADIPLQVSTTDGGQDGSAFTFYGAHHVMIGWPGRYSHSPAETLDLVDLDNLARLIVVLGTAP
ncbi:MAG TPA: M20/M25/M40 family metallo-hydrolase [Gemmatimonadaceae bacterium]|jgi:putative aminopeptidase FrvX|nr:M20/M25/M40 family metallo-hydrolase [Gemmatimonadaceae bacterium]